jgi:hypothetical protein
MVRTSHPVGMPVGESSPGRCVCKPKARNTLQGGKTELGADVTSITLMCVYTSRLRDRVTFVGKFFVDLL